MNAADPSPEPPARVPPRAALDMRHPARRRRWWRWSLAVAAAVAVAWGCTGCTSTITPPAHPERATTVFLLREAMHTGIVLPPLGDSREYVEFGFGDWRWFALGDEAWYRVFATVLWPTPGTLGQRRFVASNEAQLRERVAWAELVPIPVDGERVRVLRARLQQSFDASLADAVRRPELGWTFVPSERGYWFAQTCADVAAEWLCELGCEVSWVPIRASLTVAQ